MKPAPQSPGALFFAGLALVLVVVLSVWCVIVATNVEGLRGAVATNVRHLVRLEDLRTDTLRLEALVLHPTDDPGREPAAARWPPAYAATDSVLRSLEADQDLTGEVRDHLRDIASALTVMNEAAETLLGSTLEPVAAQDQEARFHRAQRNAMTHVGTAIEAIRTRQAAVSSRLAASWRSLFLLAIFSVGTTIVLVIVLRRALRDAARHEKAEQALRESEERFGSVLAAVPDVILVLSAEGEYRYVFTAEPRLLFTPKENLLGKTIHDVLPKDAAAPIQTVIDEALRTDELQHFDYPLMIADEQKWFSARVVPFKSTDDPSVVWVARDVTDQRRTEEALRESEERFRSAFDHSAVGMALARVDGRFLEVNHAFCRMLGYSEKELLHKTFVDITYPDDVEESVAQVRRLLDGELSTYTIEKRYIRKQGDVVWSLTSVAPVLDTQGRPLYFVGETQDITERKRAEEALRDSEERLRQLAENISEVFWITSGDGREMIYISPAYEEIWGRTCQSLYDRPKNWSEAIHDEDRQRAAGAFFGGAAKSGYDEEYRVVRPDGSIRWIRDRGFPIVDDAGEVHRIAGIAEDITELVRHREHLETIVEERTAKLMESHARLRVADRLASIGTLAAGLGHDMSNLLFPLRLRFDALNWETLPADLKGLLEAVRENVDYLQQLSDGLRMLAVDPEDSEASEGSTSLPEWWSHVRPLISKMLPEHVSLETDIVADLPRVAVAPHRLTQAVLNLLINAAEASPDGGRVRVWAHRNRDEPFVRLAVSDDGVGMTEEVRQRVFDPFFTTKKRSLSTGLGLSLVHVVVTLSGGTASIESSPGKGTSVELTFPLALDPAPAPGHGPAGGQPRATVSLSDPRVAAWVSSVLSSAGYEVDRSGDGEPRDSLLWVTEPTERNLRTAKIFTSGPSKRRVIVLGATDADWSRLGAKVVGDVGDLESIRSAVREISHAETEPARREELR
ncbi:MAG: PAS domain S-box protein [Planctomycetota bacterium]|jgi:PAS domain S-box-containing protein